MIQLRKKDVYMPFSESFQISDHETKYRFLRGEVKTALLLGGKTCTLCRGGICHSFEIVHAVNGSSLNDVPGSPNESTASRRVQGPLETHTCTFFCVALACNKSCDTLCMVICYVQYGFDYGPSRMSLPGTPHKTLASPAGSAKVTGPPDPELSSRMPIPVVLIYTVTPSVMMAVSCSVLCLADTMLEECAQAQSLSSAKGDRVPTDCHVYDDGSLDFLLESHVDVHSLHKTVEFCISVVLQPFYDNTQLLGAKSVLLKVGEALFKHCSPRPLVKPFVNELVEGADLHSHYVKNPTRQLVLQLQKNRIFSHAGASGIGRKDMLNVHFTPRSPIARITGLPAEQLAVLLFPWTALHAARFENQLLWAEGDRASVLQDLLRNADLVQLLYAVCCFLYPTQCAFYAEELGITCADTLSRKKMMEVQVRFLSSFLQAIAPLEHRHNFERSDTMLIVARVHPTPSLRL